MSPRMEKEHNSNRVIESAVKISQKKNISKQD